MRTKVLRLTVLLALVLPTLMMAGASAARPAGAGPSAAQPNRYLVVTRSAADAAALRAAVAGLGGAVVNDMADVNLLVVSGPARLKQQLAANPLVKGVANDRIERIVPPEAAPVQPGQQPGQPTQVAAPAPSRTTVTADPAFALPGLMWNIDRLDAPQAWQTTTGSKQVTVGVADTGLDFTHSDLAPNITSVVDLTTSEDPPLCKTLFGTSDQDLAAQFGGPATTDWNGHGSWIGGNIAGALNGQGINGIAPSAGLVSLKISQWCGYAYDSTILNAFLYAASHGINIVSISFGGYLDLSDQEQQLIYEQYAAVVDYARKKGTTIVAAAGNEHVQIGAGGQVLSHGLLTTPGATQADFVDLYGLYEVPGGIPGVVDVASTGNVVNAASQNCPGGIANSSDTPCKPASDRHQPFGVGQQNQLAYYSNYGPRIDVAAPGGARKFNLPVWDRGGTAGFPVTTADQFAAWEAFSTTSNWATQIPCYVFTSDGFPANQCYTAIQGTSMATPHASGVLALIASANPALRSQPDALVSVLKASARKISGNTTPPLSASDTSPGDLPGSGACGTGYCHLGGSAIPDAEAYGAGLVDAAAAVSAAGRGR